MILLVKVFVGSIDLPYTCCTSHTLFINPTGTTGIGVVKMNVYKPDLVLDI